MIRNLIQNYIPENAAKAAVQVIKSLDIDDCYMWALENANNEKEIEKLQKEFDEEIGEQMLILVNYRTVWFQFNY